jgi:methionyl-tRNA formyltransferase
MAAKLDSGDIIEQLEVPIESGESSGQLLERLTPLGATLLASTMELLSRGQAPRRPQDETQVTLCPRITREMAQINWQDGARKITNQVRAMNPWPTAWCLFRDEPLKIWQATARDGHAPAPGTFLGTSEGNLEVATGEGVLQVHEVQAAGRPRMVGADWARGARLQPGEKFS